MSIQSDIKELNELDLEIKRLLTQLVNIRKMKKNVENRISVYLNDKNQPGVKYNGSAIILERKEKRTRMSKKEKEQCAISVLNKYNISNSKNVLDEIQESMKGAPTEITKIKITKIKI